jgi:hypothetical protein
MMNPTNRSATKLFLFVGIGLLTSFPGRADAAPIFCGQVTLPYEVRWGVAVLPAGPYILIVDSVSQPVQIFTMGGEEKFSSMPEFTDQNHGSQSSLVISMRGDKRVVNSLNIPRQGLSLVFMPPSKIQREEAAMTHSVHNQGVIAAKR